MYTNAKGQITVEVQLGTTPVGSILRKPRQCSPERWTVSVCGEAVKLRDPHGSAHVCLTATPSDMCTAGYA